MAEAKSASKSVVSRRASVAKGARITGVHRDKLAAQLKKKYESGKSVRELSNATGRSYGFVHRMLRESGASMRTRGGATRSRGKSKATTTPAKNARAVKSGRVTTPRLRAVV